MYSEIYKTEGDFLDRCPCSFQILDFVDSIENTDTRWFFDIGYAFYKAKKYAVIFKTYALPEYKDYVLSVEATEHKEKYTINIIKRIDNLLTDND